MASNLRNARSTDAGTRKKRERERKHFNKADWNLLCDWLEIDSNLEAIQGTEGKTKVGGKHPKKKTSLESLADYINTHQLRGTNLKPLDGLSARNRIMYLKEKYRLAIKKTKAIGWGLTEEDQRNGVKSLVEKEEALCPCYSRLEKLFGNSPSMNVQDNLYFTPVTQVVPDSLPMPSFASASMDLDEHDEDGLPENEFADNIYLDDFEEEPNVEEVPPTPTPVSEEPAHRNPPVQERPAAYRSPLVDERPHTPLPQPQQSVPTEVPGGISVRRRKSFEYPNKKQINESRHSMNSSFAATMDTFAGQREKVCGVKESAIDIARQKFEYDRQVMRENQELERIDRAQRFAFESNLEEKKFLESEKKRLQARELEEKRQDLKEKRLDIELKQVELKIAAKRSESKLRIAAGKDQAKRQAKVKILADSMCTSRSAKEITALLALLD